MKRIVNRLAMSAAITLSFQAPVAHSQVPDWTRVDQAISRTGQVQPDGVVRYGFPRTDLTVTIGSIRLKPSFALGTWIAMKRLTATSAMMMGDLVLTEDEVAPVLQELHRGNVMATALHNHLRGESPHVLYMHVSAHGDPVALARTIKSALGRTATPMSAPAPSPAAPSEFDTAAIAAALGYHGKMNGGVLQVSIPRRERIAEFGQEIPPTMGAATAINFQPVGDGNAAITGDFVMISSEVDAVSRALEQNGIAITALHSHMNAESPRLFFMHFWATGDPVTLAKGLRMAIGRTNSKRPL